MSELAMHTRLKHSCGIKRNLLVVHRVFQFFENVCKLMPFWPLMSASSLTCFVELDLASVKNRLILFLRSETPLLLLLRLLLGAWKGCEDFVGHNKAITCHRYGLWNLSCRVLDQNDTGNVTHSMTHKALFQLKGAHNVQVFFFFSFLIVSAICEKRCRYLPSSLSLNQTNFLWRTTDSQNYRLWFILRSSKWENQGIIRLKATLGFKHLPNINISPTFSVQLMRD